MKVYKKGYVVDIDINQNLLFCNTNDFKKGKLVYSLFAERICYECQEDQTEHFKGYFHLVRTSPLYYTTVCELEDKPNNLPIPPSSIEREFRGAVVAYDREKLLITIRCDDFFFEVECDYISISEVSAGTVYCSVVNPKFYSDKFSEE